MSALFDETVRTLEKSLDLHLARHVVISDNIANAETPGFRARQVEFEDTLARAVESGDPGEIENAGARITEDSQGAVRPDLNTVDRDKQMALLTRNEASYSAATQAISRKFALLKYAITEGSDK